MDKHKPTFDLSVVIVNYNVTYFLEQCLNAVLAASKTLNVQVFVVDNNSVDGSVEMVQTKFPGVQLIANKENVGFSRANNQALVLSDARYLLLLNPDTVVEEDTFSKVIQFMDGNQEAGGLGVRMVDGKGRFLPESKRGLPTPMVAFYKIFGHYFGEKTGLMDIIDIKTSDVTRACFMSYDEDAFYNAESECIDMNEYLNKENIEQVEKSIKEIELKFDEQVSEIPKISQNLEQDVLDQIKAKLIQR